MLFSSKSTLPAIEDTSSAYSLPNKSTNTPVRLAFGNFSTRFKKSTIAPCPSLAMFFFSCLAEIPTSFSAAWNFLPPLSAVLSEVSIPLIAVLATSGDLPNEIKVLAKAAAAFSVKPKSLDTPAIRPSVFTISDALAGELFDNSLIASPKSPILLIGILYTLASFAIESPLCSADISKATDILAMVVVNSFKSCSATPN